MDVRRIEGQGWLALLGGGEFSFEETEEADRAWLAKAGAGPVAFLPTASGSEDYGRHFAVYLDEYFERPCETVPVYRSRDARRGRNAEKISAAAAVYLGGGVPETLLETLSGSAALEALAGKLASGGVVAAIATRGPGLRRAPALAPRALDLGRIRLASERSRGDQLRPGARPQAAQAHG